MRNCFIPGCDQLCKATGTLKRKMFVVPKDKETFNAWMEVLPKQRTLKPHDKVCERHFNEEDISTTYDNVVNGQLYKMERGRPKLRPKAVPSRNIEHVKAPKRLKKNVIINVNVKDAAKQIQDETTKTPPSITDEEQNIEMDGEVHDLTEINVSDSSETIVAYEVTSDNQIEVSEVQIVELFESLYEDVYEVELPNTLWGVHRCPDKSSVFFSFVDPKIMRTTKTIAITCEGHVKVLLGNRLMSEQNLIVDITSIESLSETITDIDAVKLCSKLYENDFCEVSVKDPYDVCANCAQSEQVL